MIFNYPSALTAVDGQQLVERADPSFVAYTSEIAQAARIVERETELALRLFHNCLGQVIPRHPFEDTAAHSQRVNQAVVAPDTGRALSRLAGSLVSAAQISTPPQLPPAYLQDITGNGDSAESQLAAGLKLAAVSGGCWFLISTKGDGQGRTLAQWRKTNRASLSVLPRSAVTSVITDSKGRMSQAVVESTYSVPTGFGSKEIPAFTVYRRGLDGEAGTWSMYLVQGAKTVAADGKTASDGPIASGVMPFSDLPLVWVSWTASSHDNPVMGPAAGIAQAHKAIVRLDSQLQSTIEQTAMPIIWRRGTTVRPDGTAEPFILGPNSLQDLGNDPSAAVGVEEMSGSAIAPIVALIEAYREQIEDSVSQALSIRSHQSAGAISEQASRLSSGITVALSAFSSAWQRAMQLLLMAEGSKAQAAEDLLSWSMEALSLTDRSAAVHSMLDRGLISPHTALRALVATGAAPSAINFDADLQRLAQADQVIDPEDPANYAPGGALDREVDVAAMLRRIGS